MGVRGYQTYTPLDFSMNFHDVLTVSRASLSGSSFAEEDGKITTGVSSRAETTRLAIRFISKQSALVACTEKEYYC